MWKEAAVVAKYLPEGTEKTHEKNISQGIPSLSRELKPGYLEHDSEASIILRRYSM
jgi:hypothetical protein